MAFTGKWIGLKEANRALRRQPALAQVEVQQTIDATAFQVYQGASQRVRRRTGFLASQLGWQSRPRSLSAVVGVRPGAAFYWKYLEYGTVHMAAKPFLRPAAEAMESGHETRLTQALERALTQMEQQSRP